MMSCQNEDVSERIKLLTGPTWVSDSLLANGVDAGNPGEFLGKFKGEAKFNEDGTGIFGDYTGTWELTYNETQLIISSDSLALPVVTGLEELTASSLKITAAVPNVIEPAPIKLRMTFKAK